MSKIKSNVIIAVQYYAQLIDKLKKIMDYQNSC